MSLPKNPVIIIPARLAATRLPGKILADIHGEPMIVHVPLCVGDIEQPGRLGVTNHVIQSPLNGAAIAASPGEIAGGKECESTHAHHP